MSSRFICALLLGFLGAGCASTRGVRLETGEGAPLEYVPPTWGGSVEVDEDDFEEALALLVLELPLSLRPSEAGWLVRASTRGGMVDRALRSTLHRDYGHWCRAHEAPGDCLSLLEDGLGLGETDRLKLALGLSLDPMHESLANAVEDTLNPTFFKAVVVSALVSWALLAAAPEPLFTKAAAAVALVMVAYLGGEVFLRVVAACGELKRAADRATTFQELEEAGARFGGVVGDAGARIFVLAVAAVVSGGTTGGAAWLASRLPLFPGIGQAAALSASQVGVDLAAIDQVSAVAVVEGTLVITLAPNAVAMAARSGGRKQDHHLATIRNEKSAARGGPWTPRFKRIFDKAGMKLKDPENVVPVEGHKGPHPQAYHERVYRRLELATEDCRNIASCKSALQKELRLLAKEASTPGTLLNNLLTQRVKP
ncbi:AHH domain-containing protein [Pyxidicoccus trucidator]|uniref:AHH domain-containing protein n=1 Tax=Pyxidicoccus trucidator TaxID=2709662 RepID=UPI0013D9BA16|nr:AHH domain-containing protein [Pyxidicoccus trucidator]